MKPGKNILQELEEIAPLLARIDKADLYQVEEGYFLAAQLKIIELVGKPAVKSELSPVLSLIGKKEVYSAPSPVYFQSFSEAIIAKVHAADVAEELAYALPLLQHADKKELYEVPASYFESFSGNMISEIHKQHNPHSTPVERWYTKWSIAAESLFDRITRPAYAFAIASVVSVVVCFSLVMNNKTLSAEDKIVAQMQQIPDADLHHYISRHRDEFDEHTILHDINNIDFTHYFDKPEQVTPHIEDHISVTKDDDMLNDEILD